jgi:hypothetical protein
MFTLTFYSNSMTPDVNFDALDVTADALTVNFDTRDVTGDALNVNLDTLNVTADVLSDDSDTFSYNHYNFLRQG